MSRTCPPWSTARSRNCARCSRRRPRHRRAGGRGRHRRAAARRRHRPTTGAAAPVAQATRRSRPPPASSVIWLAAPRARPRPRQPRRRLTGTEQGHRPRGCPDSPPTPTPWCRRSPDRGCVLRGEGAHHVALVGDFNGWNARATPLTRAPGGDLWSVTVPLMPGRHAYAFMVDDTAFVLDPQAPVSRDPDLGSRESVVVVERR